jgi:hypothetical protein
VSSIDLISLKIQILGRKVLFKNPGFKSPWGRVKFFAIIFFLYLYYGEYDNEKKRGQKFFTFLNGDLNPKFLNKFCPQFEF